MKISVHPLFFLFGIYFALTGKVFLFLNFTLTALVHETGHAIAAERLGYKMNKISLMPYGAVVNGAIEGLSYKDEIKVALSGPLANFCVCVLFTCFFWLVPEWYPYLESVVFSSLCVFAINLIPAYPLDGGRVLSATLSLFFSRKKSMLVTKVIGILFSLCLFALFIYSICIKQINISILFFALFALVGTLKKSKENSYVRAFFFRALPPKSVKECKHLIVSSSLLLKDLIAISDKTCFFTMEIHFEDKKERLFLDYLESEKVLASYRLYDSVGEIAEEICGR